MSAVEHGYVRYSHGCRCDTCRRAKADYMSAARKLPAGDSDARPFKHGRHGYEVKRCRCRVCTVAHVASDKRVRRPGLRTP